MIDPETQDHVVSRLCWYSGRSYRDTVIVWRAVSIGVLRLYGILTTPVSEKWYTEGHPIYTPKEVAA